MEFDPQMSFISAYPAPTSVVGNLVTWNLPALIGYDFVYASVQLQVPVDIGLIRGAPYSHIATASQGLAEVTLANNSVARNSFFTASYDPNDKLVETSFGGERKPVPHR